MGSNAVLAVVVLIFPVIAAVGMIWFMMGGKGKPAPTQDEIKAAKARKEAKNHAEE